MAFEKILVVDDEPIIRRSVAEHFQKRRYSVYQAESIHEAKDQIASESFDFIVIQNQDGERVGWRIIFH